MKDRYIVFISIFLSLYFILNYYVGKVVLKVFNIIIETPPLLFWLIFGILASSYIISMLFNKYLSYNLTDLLAFIGSYWLGLLMYVCIAFPILWLTNLLLRKLSLFNSKIYTGEIISVTILFFILLILGSYNAKNHHVNTFEINISKLKEPLNIVMVSDLHLGSIVKNTSLINMVNEINELNPDIVVIAGDIIDSDLDPFLNHNMAKEFSNLKSKYGTFAVLGNHDVLTKKEDEIVDILEENYVNVLRDESILINDNFYLIGRDDISINRFSNKPRATLEKITKDLDKSKPLIVIDHNPKYISESLDANIDLQLSGHTHKGQIIPGNIVTSKIFEVDYGYLNKDDLNIVVSSGYGTWGPPIRLGSRSEIIQIKLRMKE